MADKPSRALVLYAAGHAALLAGGGGGKGHLDAFASIASCGFLSVRSPAVNEACLILNSSTETDSDLKLLRPRQSYTMKAGKTLDDVRNHHPMLLAQWQQGVTRSDLAKDFSFEEFIKRAGNFAMLAERFLHEVAFKLWKAPKYGA
ncbi:hypothetical protein ACQJBY_053420 [Aegilops geniculata]